MVTWGPGHSPWSTLGATRSIVLPPLAVSSDRDLGDEDPFPGDRSPNPIEITLSRARSLEDAVRAFLDALDGCDEIEGAGQRVVAAHKARIRVEMLLERKVSR